MLNLIITFLITGLMVGIVALSFTAMKRMDVANKLFMIADVLLLTGLTILLVCIYVYA
ncbi:hypothetical protein [Mogibacterium diversum]|jgi:hypothetical protein|uniref:hypothetical protein n=1 Tax=Mogibacterium diversum TaxID=114527 RepID=UPI00131A2174|nr:hypothetical protein [Mogibacterium diversum]DAM74178.1 MAG TPA: hypothetical protein [Caudoviricetes sp.]DAO28136.1 MAG TPA: hypothetical protein [Caudoviricetes sp.]